MISGTEEIYTKAKEDLESVQSKDVSRLIRKDDLGGMNFEVIIEQAKQVVQLYNRLSSAALEDFPDRDLQGLSGTIGQTISLFTKVENYSLETNNHTAERNAIIKGFEDEYQRVFPKIHPYIAYSIYKSADFARIEAKAQATLKKIEKETEAKRDELKVMKQEVESLVTQVREVAAEAGVSNQAIYFQQESEDHARESSRFGRYVVWFSVGIFTYAVLSLFLHKLPILKPENTFDAVQLVVSKVLIFSVLIYGLVLSAKNFLNHKHNSIVNKHRQNALFTHRALVEASGEKGVRDAILIQASSCIFSPQSTGYTQKEAESTNQKSMIEIMSKPVVEVTKSAAKT